MTRGRPFAVVVSTVVIGGLSAVPTQATPILSGVPTSVSAAEGVQTINFSFTDTAAGPYSIDANWGDGTPDSIVGVSSPASIGLTHHFEEGSFSVMLTVTDGSGATDSASFTETVAEVALAPGGTTSSTSGFQGVPLGLGNLFNDPGGVEPLSDYAATFDWGDGTVSAGTISLCGACIGFQLSSFGTHTYATGGTFTIEDAINHEGLVTTDTWVVTIAGSTPAPEPTTLTLTALGLAGIVRRYRRGRAKSSEHS